MAKKKPRKTYKKKKPIKKKPRQPMPQRSYMPSVPRPSIPRPDVGGYVKGKATQAATSVVVGNPIVAAIAVIIGFAIVFVLGGFTLLKITAILTNIWFWLVAIGSVMLIRPKGFWRLLGNSFLVGGIFWIWETYNAYKEAGTVCNTPILGQLICNSGGLFDWLYWYPLYLQWGLSLIVHLATAFMVIAGFNYLRYALLKNTRLA